MSMRMLALAVPFLLSSPSVFAADDSFPMDFSKDMGSITIDASVLHTATPDVVNAIVSCDVPEADSKEKVRAGFREQISALKQAAGQDAQIRRASSFGIYSSEMESGDTTYWGNMSVNVVRIAKDRTNQLNEEVENNNCTISWDIRLLNTGKYAKLYKNELLNQIKEKKEVYESIIGQPLIRVSGMNFITSADNGYGYSGNSYDFESNTMDAMTMLSIYFATGPVSKP